MLLSYSSKSWFLVGLACLLFFSCGVLREYRVDRLWKFLSADHSQQVILYYHVENDQFHLRIEKKSDKAQILNIRMRIYDSRQKKSFFEIPAQHISITGRQDTNKPQVVTFKIPDKKSVQSIDVIEFTIDENPPEKN